MMTVVPLPVPTREITSKTTTAVRGRGLAFRKLSKGARALLAAEIHEGTVVLSDLSVKQLAAIVGCSSAYVHAALRASPLEREAVRRGLRPLVQAHAPTGPQERLSKIVDEIGLDRTINLLASFEAVA
jgi:hypothetical protein